jgi:hypothetical protein
MCAADVHRPPDSEKDLPEGRVATPNSFGVVILLPYPRPKQTWGGHSIVNDFGVVIGGSSDPPPTRAV